MDLASWFVQQLADPKQAAIPNVGQRLADLVPTANTLRQQRAFPGFQHQVMGAVDPKTGEINSGALASAYAGYDPVSFAKGKLGMTSGTERLTDFQRRQQLNVQTAPAKKRIDELTVAWQNASTEEDRSRIEQEIINLTSQIRALGETDYAPRMFMSVRESQKEQIQRGREVSRTIGEVARSFEQGLIGRNMVEMANRFSTAASLYPAALRGEAPAQRALIVGFNKILEPTSAVMQGEAEATSAANAIASFFRELSRIRGIITQGTDSASASADLTPQDIQKVASAINTMAASLWPAFGAVKEKRNTLLRRRLMQLGVPEAETQSFDLSEWTEIPNGFQRIPLTNVPDASKNTGGGKDAGEAGSSAANPVLVNSKAQLEKLAPGTWYRVANWAAATPAKQK